MTNSEVDNKETKKPKPKKKHKNSSENKGQLFRIFRVEKDEKTGEENEITMFRFRAKDNDEAYAELKRFRRIANKKYTYYFGVAGTCGSTKSGSTKYYDSIKEMLKAEASIEPIWKRIFDELTWPFFKLGYILQDMKFWISNLIFFMKTKHQKSEHWSLDSHLVDDIIFNIPRLFSNGSHGVPNDFAMKARVELNKDNPKFDLEKSMVENPNFSSEELDLAGELWDKELEKGLLYAKLFKFYTNFGIVDEDDPEEQAFLKTWEKTIPYIPGTYKEIDYKKLMSLENKYWNSLWNWIKDNGRNLWD